MRLEGTILDPPTSNPVQPKTIIPRWTLHPNRLGSPDRGNEPVLVLEIDADGNAIYEG